MKRLLTILGASLFLVGCGSQNLGPLEDKTTNSTTKSRYK